MGQMQIWFGGVACCGLCASTHCTLWQGKNQQAFLHGILASNLPETSKVQLTFNNGIFLLTTYDGPLDATP